MDKVIEAYTRRVKENLLKEIENAYGDSEELLYGDFKKLKEEILEKIIDE